MKKEAKGSLKILLTFEASQLSFRSCGLEIKTLNSTLYENSRIPNFRKYELARVEHLGITENILEKFRLHLREDVKNVDHHNNNNNNNI
ncbi:CLUMA_CG019348, isoform A [Clunio marinus]|uniref:CLUMA_CG019348, isoform A n=1 Tax=Clunio marinus TaxID=568069 RepID=A0A1J1J341_9DIPT|nr:CLUMA_CG019348, isoform A [Clunio marinus]